MFQIYSTIDSVKTLKNGSLKIAIETQDITLFPPEQLVEIFKLNDKYVYTAFKEVEIKEEDLDIKELPTEFKGDKTPSQRLRSVLYVYWEQHKPTSDFNTYYSNYIDAIIRNVKDKLD